MKILIKSARIIDDESPFDNQIMDILIQDGTISRISPSIEAADVDQELEYENLHVSPGWFDSSVNFGEPGFEERETIANGLRVAAMSGFTAVAVNPGNKPVTDNKGAVSFLRQKAAGQPVELYPIGALTLESRGKALAELYDMQQAGATAFGDYKQPVENPNMLKIALQYAQNFGALILSYPQDSAIAGNGQVNEQHNSTLLGLKGIPALAEELQIARDLFILEYTGGKLHIPTISTARAVDLIREAKEKGLDVSCSVSVHNLLFTDDVLKEFDTNAKVLPPLRTRGDIKALIGGIKDGTIDMVTTDHTPIDIENKKTEFDNALFGTLGLESAFGALMQVCSLKTAIKALTGGRGRFDIQEPIIEEGSDADLTFFNPEVTYTMNRNQILSSSKNSLFEGLTLKGRVYGVYAKGSFLESKILVK